VFFPISGVNVSPFIPPLVAFCVSFLTSMGGISGAVLLLPFQMSILHFTSPSVSPTNLIFNLVATPSGIYRYIKEGRMVWPLAWVLIIGTLPGIFIGAILRVKYLHDPGTFKVFAGLVLLCLGLRLFYDAIGNKPNLTSSIPPDTGIKITKLSIEEVEYEFCRERLTFNCPILFAFAFAIGIIGGAYGIGGGAIIAPFLVTSFALPVHTIAGAALMSTFVTSLAGVFFYNFLGKIYAHPGLVITPDWLLGILFGFGGGLGMYWGARSQKFIPEKIIKAILGVVVLFLSVQYIIQYMI